ncbi:hypothetical protein ML462_02755 [Gramella lutea]|uniref:Uncharacterized protein n=1 Tax=Christiangramia lutea TaxID=1607951 RepID=A0A9X1V1E0_9FLAO|nr:hypothetical protein [Christiangramia lutea]MCH4822080.1 hypothetical protein [Christiangramia lutea]
MRIKTFFLLSLSFFLFSSVTYAQQIIELTILVETNTITQDNIPETCRFENQPEDTSILDYTTYVSIGDKVKWRIKRADDNKGSVKLVKYKHGTGPSFFNQDSIPEKNGKIEGTIVLGSENEVDKYAIEIMVKKKGENEWVNYIIDPKLQIKARE